MPGGLLEAGERLEAAVRREVLEETGLEVQPLGIFEVFERISHDARGRTEYHYVLVDYLCRVAGGEVRASSDAAGAEWVRRSDLEHYRITDGTLEVIERAFGTCGRGLLHR